MEILTQEQRFNEIIMPKTSTYVIALMATAVQQNLISDEVASKKMKSFTTFIKRIAKENCNNSAVSVNQKIIVSNYFTILAMYLSSYSNWKAFELCMNTTVADLVSKAEKHYIGVNRIMMAKVSKMTIPEGMYKVLKEINNSYNNIMNRYLAEDLSKVKAEILSIFLVSPTEDNSIEFFWKSIEHFCIEASIITKNFPDSLVKEIRRNLSSASEELKKEKLEKIDEEIKKIQKWRDESIANVSERLKSYQERQKELDEILDGMSEEEIDSEKTDKLLEKYDFDIFEEEEKAEKQIRGIKKHFNEKLDRLEEKKSKLTVKVNLTHKSTYNILKEIINEWLLYSYSVSENKKYSNLTSFAKQNYIDKLDKKWIKSKISELILSEKESMYVKKGLGIVE